MIYTILFIAFLVGIIYIVSVIGEKKPSTSKEIKDAIFNEVSKIEIPYDFDKGTNIQQIGNIKTKGWYVADCIEYYRIITFSEKNDVRISTASKEMLKNWDYGEYMKDVKKRLNDGNKISVIIDNIKNLIELKFPENNDRNLVYLCKLKTNGVLIVRRKFTDSERNILVCKEEQYLHQTENSIGYDITLNQFITQKEY